MWISCKKNYGNVLATIAIILSFVTLWRQFFWQSSLALKTGDAISINHTSNGKTEVYLPISIQSEGSSSQVINRLALIINLGNGRFGLMRKFCTLSEDKNTMSISSKFTPITVDSNANFSKILGFGLEGKEFQEWIPTVGVNYEFWVIGWTASNTDPQAPNIKTKFEFNFTEKDVQDIKETISENKLKKARSKNARKDTNENFDVRTVSWSFQDFPKSGYLTKEQFKQYTK